MKENKFKEYYINYDESQVFTHDDWFDYKQQCKEYKMSIPESLHMIEYRAYEELQMENWRLDLAQTEWPSRYETMKQKLKDEIKILKAQIENRDERIFELETLMQQDSMTNRMFELFETRREVDEENKQIRQEVEKLKDKINKIQKQRKEDFHNDVCLKSMGCQCKLWEKETE